MSDSEVKKATEALRRENEKLAAEKKKQDKEIADLLKNVWNYSIVLFMK